MSRVRQEGKLPAAKPPTTSTTKKMNVRTRAPSMRRFRDSLSGRHRASRGDLAILCLHGQTLMKQSYKSQGTAKESVRLR